MTGSNRYIVANFTKEDKEIKMFKISYIDKRTNELAHSPTFKSDKEAYQWADAHDSTAVPLRLLIWSEAIQCYRVIEKL